MKNVIELKEINDLLKIEIDPIDNELYKAVQNKWDAVAKPLNGLGRFEVVFDRIGAIKGSTDFSIKKRAIIAMCADNGVVAEGVSQSGQDVTYTVASFMGKNQSSVGKMASVAGADIIPIDIGINCDDSPEGVINYKVAKGTKNFLREPAMSEEEALKAISVGINLVRKCRDDGYELIGTGEMGIGNTTTSSAIAAAILNCRVEEITGRGAGLDDKGLARKIEVISNALEKYGFMEPRSSDTCSNISNVTGEEKLKVFSNPIYCNLKDGKDIEDRARCFQILRTVGGLDIAGLVGVFIGGAIYKIPIVLDGIISSVAALIAEKLVPGTKEYMIASHVSREPAAIGVMDDLGLFPVIYGDLALGEGTGAVMMFSLLDVAFSLYESETTFDEMQIEQYERFV